jgi:hypothetical protein
LINYLITIMKWKQILEKDALWFSLDVGFWYLPWRHYQERVMLSAKTHP